MSKIYKYNDCGVVINPCQIWFFKPLNAYAWIQFEFSVAKCQNGLWDLGTHNIGSGGSCSYGRFKTKNIAIEKGIEYFKEYFKTPYTNQAMANEKYYADAKKSFQLFLNNRFFSKTPLVKNDYVYLSDENYTQTSLF